MIKITLNFFPRIKRKTQQIRLNHNNYFCIFFLNLYLHSDIYYYSLYISSARKRDINYYFINNKKRNHHLSKTYFYL